MSPRRDTSETWHVFNDCFCSPYVEKNEAEEQEAKQEIKRRLSRKVNTHTHTEATIVVIFLTHLNISVYTIIISNKRKLSSSYFSSSCNSRLQKRNKNRKALIFLQHT